jgi:hypothetical protein
MDISRPSTRALNVTQYRAQGKPQQAVESQITASQDQSVSSGSVERVGGSAESKAGDLGSYLHLLGGREAPAMGSYVSGAEDGEEASKLPPLLGADEETEGQATEVEGEEEAADPSAEKSVSGEVLSKEESAEVQKLKARDQEVRTHEQAHVAAGGQYIRGGITYDYQKGPDGRSYAVGGHVDIDLSEEDSPEATITKMRQVQRAALAPAEPSGADRAVASAAASKEQQAQAELAEERQAQAAEGREKGKEVREASSTEGEARGEEGSSPESTRDTPDVEAPAPRAPRTREMMNLARESRLRMMRGDFWVG